MIFEANSNFEATRRTSPISVGIEDGNTPSEAPPVSEAVFCEESAAIPANPTPYGKDDPERFPSFTVERAVDSAPSGRTIE